jgi:hypothetical protein
VGGLNMEHTVLLGEIKKKDSYWGKIVDGIYPSYLTFVKSIRLPQSEPDKLFATYREGYRKDIERAFGVLQARFKIIREPARFWDTTDLALIMRSCIILHNMIVEDERDTYAQHWTDYDQSKASRSSTPEPFSTEVLPVFANHVCARSVMRDSNGHHELQGVFFWIKGELFLYKIIKFLNTIFVLIRYIITLWLLIITRILKK